MKPSYYITIGICSLAVVKGCPVLVGPQDAWFIRTNDNKKRTFVEFDHSKGKLLGPDRNLALTVVSRRDNPFYRISDYVKLFH